MDEKVGYKSIVEKASNISLGISAVVFIFGMVISNETLALAGSGSAALALVVNALITPRSESETKQRKH